MKPIASNCETSLRQENKELHILAEGVEAKQEIEKKIEDLVDLLDQSKSHE